MVPPGSDKVSRAPSYSGINLTFQVFAYGIVTLYDGTFQNLLLTIHVVMIYPTTPIRRLVWPIPISLATTLGISVDFSSYRYLDVSVPCVRPIQL